VSPVAVDPDWVVSPLWCTDAQLRDDLWRAENPGASAVRGLLWAVPVSLAMWASLAGALALLLLG